MNKSSIKSKPKAKESLTPINGKVPGTFSPNNGIDRDGFKSLLD